MAEKGQSPRAAESFEKTLKPKFWWDKEGSRNGDISRNGVWGERF